MADALKTRKQDIAKLSDRKIGPVPVVAVEDLVDLGVKHNSGGPVLFHIDIQGLGRFYVAAQYFRIPVAIYVELESDGDVTVVLPVLIEGGKDKQKGIKFNDQKRKMTFLRRVCLWMVLSSHKNNLLS